MHSKSNSDEEIVNIRRRQTRARESRAKLIEAATGEFAARGFDGASTRQIAELAGLKHALLIYHFGSKRALWEAVMEKVVGRFLESFARRQEEDVNCDDVRRLKGLFAEFIRLAATYPELHRLMSHEAWEGGERIEWIMRQLLAHDNIPFVALIESVQAQGRFVKGDPYHLYYTFLGAAARIFMLGGEIELVTGRSPFEAEYVEQHVQICEELFFR
ncbi:TetR family transcriptional regulator [Sphingobium sp. MK2]|uniref:TetR/AcrR family transcriptional regulator n=1 Tax=Sphingobium sp. MK2 TaxID=3116540 RepID=UPI0032E35C1A